MILFWDNSTHAATHWIKTSDRTRVLNSVCGKGQYYETTGSTYPAQVGAVDETGKELSLSCDGCRLELEGMIEEAKAVLGG